MTLYEYLKVKCFKESLIEKSRECHNHKPQPTPDTKKREMTEKDEQLHKKHKINSLSYPSEVITILNRASKPWNFIKRSSEAQTPTVQLIKEERIAINFDWADN